MLSSVKIYHFFQSDFKAYEVHMLVPIRCHETGKRQQIKVINLKC